MIVDMRTRSDQNLESVCFLLSASPMSLLWSAVSSEL